MAKLRTVSLFVSELDRELSWRKHDISAVAGALDKARGKAREALVRALIAVTYAHWEGFNKAALIAYADHITLQGKSYGSLRRSLSGLKATEIVQNLSEIKRKIFTSAILLERLHLIENQKANINLHSRFSKIGNLNYELFAEMISFFGIDPLSYATKAALIDESLLKSRNSIAHGDFLAIDEIKARALSKEVLSMLDRIKEDLSDAAFLKSYLR